jgi:Ala-tRNA(Pro) deacylase
MSESTASGETHGVEAVARYLDEAGVGYEVIEHEPTFSAADEAAATGTRTDEEAKTILLRSGARYRVAVLPASERLDLQKVRELLDETTHLRLATEAEMSQDFPQFDVGAAPPFGPMLPAAEVLDRKLLGCETVVCSAGDHTHSVRIDPREIVRAADPVVGDISED